ncbi:hypothetical protein ASE48_30770 [Mycobacterium sp. Root265]|uniref:hypothetical protein n=1 Tax=Mycobacterium sp. Root265 TaxID=1736504 RepID=UPI00070D0862|nr:hypothetical protein [Mycobacterium sp. Root265]KRD13058.1 hypothetical protein ASE48_30770 [Mycobacterium sp. Root265]
MTSDVVAPLPAARGRTVIDDRVRRQLIERAALSVPGVLARRTMVPGRTLPAVTLGGDRGAGTVDVQIAAAWPVEGAAVLDAVRAAVAGELAATLAEHPDRVEVTITRVESDRTPAQVADAYDDDPGAGPIEVRHRRFAPRRAATATYSGVLIAVGLIAAGAVAIREALTSADPWIAPALRWAADLQWQWWVWPLAVAAAVVGLVLLVASVTPRRRTHVSVGDHIWVPRSKARDWAFPDGETVDLDSAGEAR